MAESVIPIVPERECGTCTVCCAAFTIDKPEIQKEAGSLCRHCVKSDTGSCRIYETRPPVCRDFQCGWKQLTMLDDSWRPDISGVLVELVPEQKGTGLSLMLLENPLETLRQAWFIDFIAIGIRKDVPLSLCLPGPRGHQGVRRLINGNELHAAANMSRDAMRIVLEKYFQRLSVFNFKPHVMTHSGNDVSS